MSAFGFGGTNFHAVLEAYPKPTTCPLRPPRFATGPPSCFVWREADGGTLLGTASTGSIEVARRRRTPCLPRPGPRRQPQPVRRLPGRFRATWPSSPGRLKTSSIKLRSARSAILRRNRARIERPSAASFMKKRRDFTSQAVAFLFPGQGSQSPGMLADLALAFPEVRRGVRRVRRRPVEPTGRPRVGPFVFPTFEL